MKDDWTYDVVVNDRGQYSLWPLHRECPPGWTKVGVRGSKAQCLDHIEATWTDLLPRDARSDAPSG